MSEKIPTRTDELARQIVFLAYYYPKKKLSEIGALFTNEPIINLNNAMFYLEDLKMATIDRKKDEITPTINDDRMATLPLGDKVEELGNAIVMTLGYYARTKSDIEEHYFMNLLAGYPNEVVLCTIKKLLALGTISRYKLKSAKEGTYLFYTLPEHLEGLWGKKQFKTPKGVTLVE